MWCNFVKKIINSFLTLALVAAFIFPVQESFAIGEGVKNVTWDYGKSRCHATDLHFDPITPNDDYTFEVPGNAVCDAYIASVGLLMLSSGLATKPSCLPHNALGLLKLPVEILEDATFTPELAWPNPTTAVGLFVRTKRCASRTSEYATYQGQCIASGGTACTDPNLALATSDMISCCSSVLGWVGSVGTAVAALKIIHSTAQGAYKNARICGHDWQVWNQIDENGDETYDGSKWLKGSYGKSYQGCLQDLFNGEAYNECGISPNLTNTATSITNKYYREYIYGGKEFTDKGLNTCENPSSWNNDTRKQVLGYDDDTQKYYMTGPGNAPNYACYRFLASDLTDEAAQSAYNCCVKRSQNTLCIESRAALDDDVLSDYSYEFCEVGSRCNVGNVWYDVYESHKSLGYACAKTYSVCPYNHPLGGGTEEEKYDSSGNLKNYCQVMNHCSKLPINPYVRVSDLEGAFVSSACRDLKGDTQNIYSYETTILTMSSRNFSAPLAQCFKETMENLFLNKAGHTQCSDATEFPNSDGICASGNYLYREGESLTTPSVFIKIQSSLQSAIKVALTISVMFLGVTVLLGMSPLSKKQILSYLMKFALVMYFAVGDGWQAGFVNGVLNTSGYLSDLMFRIDESGGEEKQDGCQFPRFDYSDDNPETMFDNPAYPEGKEYLRIWDTLDCKLSRAIGYGPEASVPNLAMMLVGGMVTGGLGIVFLIASLSFAFFLFSIVVRSLHIFIMSITAIIILLYVSPITITLAMFSRTRPIFDAWWKQMLGFILQPVILFAYLGVLLTFFNFMVIGDAEFRTTGGPNDPKTLDCSVHNAKETSIYCIFGINKLKNFTGLEVIGIGLPLLENMTKQKLYSIIQVVFIMFILMTLLDKITDFSKELVGGSGLGSGWGVSGENASKAAYGIGTGIQKRRGRAVKKLAKASYNKAKSVTRSVTSEGSFK
jgi:type IV secretory pathway VirB6-like protein